METVTGVFRSRENAELAAAQLRAAGFHENRLNVLLPGASDQQVRMTPTSEMEQPGAVGKALGGAIGAAIGLGGGLELGTAVASAFIPGVGPVIAVGIAAAAIFGAGGAVAGAAVGSAADEKADVGLPADEFFFYEDALRQGRSVIFLLADDKDEAAKAREVFARAGAESLDAAREAWWIGLRSSEQEHYRALGGNFEQDEAAYRQGFEAALRKNATPYEDASEALRAQYPQVWNSDAFRRGYDRGLGYRKQVYPS